MGQEVPRLVARELNATGLASDIQHINNFSVYQTSALSFRK